MAVTLGIDFGSTYTKPLRPHDPKLLVDSRYTLFTAGLLAPVAPAAVLRIVKRSLAEERSHS